MIFYSIKEKFIFYNFPTFLFSLLPIFLITGPFLSDLAISLISLIFIYYCFKRKKFIFFNNIYFTFFLLFWVYLNVNTLINNFNLDSLKISFFLIRYGIFVIAIFELIKFNDSFLKNFFLCIFICFFSLIIDGFYQYFYGENILGWKSSTRVTSFFGDEKILGSYLSRIWPIFFGLSLVYLNKKKKIFYLFLVIFILSETLIFLSGDRTAFFYINLSAIFVIIFSKNLLKLRLITLMCSLFLVITISLFFPAAKERVVDKTISQMNYLEKNSNDEKYIFSKQHTHHYISSYKMFKDNKILGVGVKNFRHFCSDQKYEVSKLSCSTHPHNSYLQILSETGIIGFSFLFFVLIFFIKNIFQHLIYRFKGKIYFNDFEICILSGILIYLWPFVPTGNVFNNWLNIIISLYLPFILWKKQNLNNF